MASGVGGGRAGADGPPQARPPPPHPTPLANSSGSYSTRHSQMASRECEHLE